MNRYVVIRTVMACLCAMLPATVHAADPIKMTFVGVLPEHRLTLKQLGDNIPDDWTAYTHLVVQMRTSSPQRFALWIYTADGPRRLHRIAVLPQAEGDAGVQEREALRGQSGQHRAGVRRRGDPPGIDARDGLLRVERRQLGMEGTAQCPIEHQIAMPPLLEQGEQAVVGVRRADILDEPGIEQALSHRR